MNPEFGRIVAIFRTSSKGRPGWCAVACRSEPWMACLGLEISGFASHLGMVLPSGALERTTIAAASAAALRSTEPQNPLDICRGIATSRLKFEKCRDAAGTRRRVCSPTTRSRCMGRSRSDTSRGMRPKQTCSPSLSRARSQERIDIRSACEPLRSWSTQSVRPAAARERGTAGRKAHRDRAARRPA
jgi:hypothetical protein